MADAENCTRTIAITGASSRIGQAIAKRLGGAGVRLILQGLRNIDACHALAEDRDGAAEIHAVDFCDPVQVRDFGDKLRQAKVDVLVNAAALTKTGLLPNLDADDIDGMIDVNIKALVALCSAVLPGMMARRNGVIVNISSVTASRGNRGQSVYAGSKGFVESFTRALAAEYGGRGIRVNGVAPGAIDGGQLRELLSYAAEEVLASVSAKRLGTPDDVAAAVAFLCSPDAAFINGKFIAVDGGFCRGV